MNVLVVSGIWPPDVGGPASHAPELAAWLARRGHRVEVVTTASEAPAPADVPVRWVSRSLPAPVRHAAVVARIADRARRADVVYATSMVGRTSLGSALAGKPFVAKVTSDPAFERSRRRGLVGATTVDFQRGGGGLAAGVLRAVRDRSVRRASAVVCPSGYMADLARSWRGGEGGVHVLPNPAPDPDEAADIDAPLPAPLLVFAGRLTAAKDLGTLLAAIEQVPSVSLAIAGDGEERASLEREIAARGLGERVRTLGALPRSQVLGLLRAADAAVLSSAWENFPHGAVEALAMGTPVIATNVGGVPEIVSDGENGLLVPSGDAAALAAAVRRYLEDDALRQRLRERAASSVRRFAADAVYGELERLLGEAARS